MTAPEPPPLNLPGGDFAVIRSDGELRRHSGYVWRWTLADGIGRTGWVNVGPDRARESTR